MSVFIEANKVNSLYNNVGEAIKAHRKRKEWTQKQLAEKASVCQGTVSMIERGDRTPSLKVLKKLAFTLGIPLSLLVDCRNSFLSDL